MKYLSRLTEVIRFATQRYWLKMISQSDVNVYDIEVKDEQGRQGYSVTIPLSYPQGEAYKVLAEIIGIRNWILNLSHIMEAS